MVMRREFMVPYMLLFPRLPERLIVRMKETFIPKLTLYAFSVSRSCSIHRSISSQARGPKCSGNNVGEDCGALPTTACDLTTLTDLWAAVHNITEGHFVLSMGWNLSPTSVVSAPRPVYETLMTQSGKST
ncbi:hypothetical protein SELMODRAFT_408226 [Selaginella moellendorffii]|uniref:Uncharacterized protein n=1 Tax=Selaginella moellendorffii TaxID=88036 RepID=D8R7L4_SELML|nr:hypothetical protein SELMODRAFT_408226 [Selaginella moellendorffii]